MSQAAIGLTTFVCALCPPVGDAPIPDYKDEAVRVWAAGPRRSAEAMAGQSPANPGEVGLWNTPTEWPVTAIHAALLPTGRVLHYSYPAGGDGSRAKVWDPGSGNFQDVSMDTDLFCSGLSLTPDGQVFVTGGNDYDCEFQGRNTTFTYDPATWSWTPQAAMLDGRWYPSNLVLADGRTAIFSGLAFDCDSNAEMEIFTPGGGIDLVPEGHRYLSLFPWVHLMTSGKIAHVGPEASAWTFEFGVGWEWKANNSGGWRGSGTSVLVPGHYNRYMAIGGESGGNPTASCEVIDMNVQNPTWQQVAPMHHARAHADSLILPDKTVLVIGGGQDGLYGEPVKTPELYDPATDTWTELPQHVYGRMYHATSVLLPDGRVVVAGQDSGESPFWGEIYEPAYLHRSPRPVVDHAPDSFTYGQTFTIETAQAEEIDSVALIRITSVTHSVNFEQRYVGLDFDVVSEAPVGGAPSLLVTTPPTPYHAPPGHYMLFLVDSAGVPSVAPIVKLCTPHPADVDGSGIVGFSDVVQVLTAWGPCGGCPEDLDLDGAVGLGDLLIVLSTWGETCL